MITNNKITNKKEISYIINLSVDSQNVGTIKMQIYHNDFDVNSIIENFTIAVNTIKNWHFNHPNSNYEPEDDKKSFEINIDGDDKSILVSVFDADFDSSALMNRIIFAVGCLSGYLCKEKYYDKGGEF